MASVCLLAVALASAWASDDPSQTTPTAAQLRAPKGLADEYARILITFPGVYRIYGRELTSAGLDLKRVDARKLSLWNEGAEVPANFSGGEGREIRDDDYIEFVGDYARGTYSTFKPYNYQNVYFLNWATARPLRYKKEILKRTPDTITDATFMDVQHLERDFYFRESRLAPGTTDNFYWVAYAAGQPDTFPVHIDFPGLDRTFAEPIRIVMRFFGWTDVPSLKPTHKFSVQYGDGEPGNAAYDLGTFGFDGKRNFDFETSLPLEQIRPRQRVVLKTPSDRANAVDAISFDFMKLCYPRKLDAEGRDLFWFNGNILEQRLPAEVSVKGLAATSRVYSVREASSFLPCDVETSEVIILCADRETTFVAVSDNGVYSVDSVTLYHRDDLPSGIPADLDVLVLYHSILCEPVKAYTKYRNDGGLRTAAVDVTRIFDELNNGYINDVSLKRFIRFAASKAPTMRFLVLMGDSTADYRMSTSFDTPNLPHVGIPIHWIVNPATTWTGGYADDNWYASLKSANTPDIAIGRIPASTEEQAFEYIRKVIEYEQFGESKSDKALVVSSVEASFQDLATQVQTRFGDHFSTTTLLFPETEVATREVQRLREEINSGVQALYYIGHGGAWVWRVGPTDYARQKDLFSPNDIALLQNRKHYPVISASSCYTTSFDYQYGIGEAFVLQPHAGAIAVIGTPWKGTVYEGHMFNMHFYEQYLDPKTERLGEAFAAAKDRMRPARDDQVDAQTFTLLGDPCLKLVPRR